MHPETARRGRLLYLALGFLGLDVPTPRDALGTSGATRVARNRAWHRPDRARAGAPGSGPLASRASLRPTPSPACRIPAGAAGTANLRGDASPGRRDRPRRLAGHRRRELFEEVGARRGARPGRSRRRGVRDDLVRRARPRHRRAARAARRGCRRGLGRARPSYSPSTARATRVRRASPTSTASSSRWSARSRQDCA